jgi:hypothetical protein
MIAVAFAVALGGASKLYERSYPAPTPLVATPLPNAAPSGPVNVTGVPGPMGAQSGPRPFAGPGVFEPVADRRAGNPHLYSAPLVGPGGRPVDFSSATTKFPRDGMLFTSNKDPVYAWPTHPGSPPKPRRREADPYTERDATINRSDPEIGFLALTTNFEPGRTAARRQLEKLRPKDVLWDAAGRLAITQGQLDERVNRYEGRKHDRVPASMMLGPLNMQRRSAARQSGRCVENLRTPSNDWAFAADPLSVVARGGISASTRRSDDFIVMRTEAVPLVRTNLLEGTKWGNDRMPGKSREYVRARDPERTSVTGQVGFVAPRFTVAEFKQNKVREYDARRPDVSYAGLVKGPTLMDMAVETRGGRVGGLDAWKVRPMSESSKIQDPYNFPTKFHAKDRGSVTRRVRSSVQTAATGDAEIVKADGRQPTLRDGATVARTGGPPVAGASAAEFGRAQALARGLDEAHLGRARHE